MYFHSGWLKSIQNSLFIFILYSYVKKWARDLNGLKSYTDNTHVIKFLDTDPVGFPVTLEQ